MRNKLLGFCLIPLFQCASVTLAQEARFKYVVDVTHPTEDAFRVTLTMDGIQESEASFFIPAWSPGSYRMCQFGRWIDSLGAWNREGRALPVTRKGFNEWRIREANTAVKITYLAHDIPEDSLETLPTSLNEICPEYFFFNGPTLFGYFKNYKNKKYEVSYRLPGQWRIWCALDSLGPAAFTATNYDELIDAPVLAGGSQIHCTEFILNNSKYVMVINSESEISADTLLAITRPLIGYQTQLFGETPFQRYYFLMNLFTGSARAGAL